MPKFVGKKKNIFNALSEGEIELTPDAKIEFIGRPIHEEIDYYIKVLKENVTIFNEETKDKINEHIRFLIDEDKKYREPRSIVSIET